MSVEIKTRKGEETKQYAAFENYHNTCAFFDVKTEKGNVRVHNIADVRVLANVGCANEIRLGYNFTIIMLMLVITIVVSLFITPEEACTFALGSVIVWLLYTFEPYLRQLEFHL